MAVSSASPYGRDDHSTRAAERKPMARHSLDDPGYRRFAWARYWRLMRGMTMFAAAAVVVALGGLYWFGGAMPLHMAIAVGLAVFFSLLLAAALMGLVFLSSGSGHDEEVNERFEESDA
jgi:uncharacterized protein (DUF2062 family)